jgi:hypothetical protein
MTDSLFETYESRAETAGSGTEPLLTFESEGVHLMGRKALDKLVVVQNEIIDYGAISHVNWPGSVSALALIESGVTTKETINNAVERIEEFYVSVNPNAKTRCIDGRHDPELDEENLGPQVPGGAPGAALAYRLGVDKDDLTRGTFLADAESMISNYLRLGFAPGGHRDEHSEGESTVGCGAIDGMDKILATMVNPELVDDHKRVVKNLLGEAFDRDTYLRIMGAALVLQGHSDTYFRNREKIIDILEEKAKGSIATLKGDHQECLVAVNQVNGTTLASNRFSDTFSGTQVFGYDIWRSVQMAKRLLPRENQTEDRKRFITARVMSTVATLMALTDGSQRLIVRLPEQKN